MYINKTTVMQNVFSINLGMRTMGYTAKVSSVILKKLESILLIHSAKASTYLPSIFYTYV